MYGGDGRAGSVSESAVRRTEQRSVELTRALMSVALQARKAKFAKSCGVTSTYV